MVVDRFGIRGRSIAKGRRRRGMTLAPMIRGGKKNQNPAMFATTKGR